MAIIKNLEVENTYQGVVDQLTEARKRKGITQYELAKSAGVTQPTVADIESKKKRPTLITIIKMARALSEIITL